VLNPPILNRHYKIRPSAKFRADRPTYASQRSRVEIKKIEISGKAQRESARPLCPIGGFEGCEILPVAKSHGLKLKCISIRKTRNVNIGWANMHT